ncbi:hypothetical protein ACNFU2_06660 [Chryseobacterium sp. PTM-20240506]|uniref:hypothetical protein n=1 Tax=Chryseobacterium sp. PTM-20240506 TaxID=3400631 RepID=UPI003AAC29B2
MKKLFFLTAILLTVVSCEREVENVVKDETSKKQIQLKHEQNSSKSASDTIIVKNISSAAGIGPTDPAEEVDPKDITTPPRK